MVWCFQRSPGENRARQVIPFALISVRKGSRIMVGKSRGTIRGKTRSSTGGAKGGGTVGSSDAAIDDVDKVLLEKKDIIEAAQAVEALDEVEKNELELDLNEICCDAEEIMANLGEVSGTVPDMTGRGTPGGEISELAQGKRPGQHGIGIGGGAHNLGVRHGRTQSGGDIAGAGASLESSVHQDTKKPTSDK